VIKIEDLGPINRTQIDSHERRERCPVILQIGELILCGPSARSAHPPALIGVASGREVF